MKDKKRIRITIDGECFFAASAWIKDDFSDADLAPLLRELANILDAPVLEDKEIF